MRNTTTTTAQDDLFASAVADCAHLSCFKGWTFVPGPEVCILSKQPEGSCTVCIFRDGSMIIHAVDPQDNPLSLEGYANLVGCCRTVSLLED